MPFIGAAKVLDKKKTLAADVAHEGASYPRMRTLTNNKKLAVHAFELRA
ncbi:hypothetical protein HMPREF3223_01357 [Cutibacterium avidum]|nr:hypothetical protein HMPREF3223_01357 [Cutibacterium avidum]